MRIAFLFIFWGLSSIVYCQSLLQSKHYTIKDGLSQIRVLGSLQDDNGYIWVNTWNGLERFDGYSFRNFKTYPSDSVRMNNHRIVSIRKSSLNNIWCFTHNNQLYLFDIQNERFDDVFRYNKKLNPGSSIQSFFVLDRGITWVVGLRGERYRIDENIYKTEEAITLYENDGKNSPKSVLYDIYQDTDGDEWLLTDKGISIVGNKSINNHTPFNLIVETKRGIYLATHKGFFGKYDSDGNVISCISDIQIPLIGFLIQTSRDEVIIMLEDGIIVYDTTSDNYKHYHTTLNKDALTPNWFFEDSKGNFWFFSNRKKVIRIVPDKEQISYFDYTSDAEILDQHPSEGFIHEDENEVIWIKPGDGDFSFFNTETNQLERAYLLNQNKKELFTFQSFNHIVDTHNNIWYANNQGVNYVSFTGKNYEQIVNPDGLEARSLMEDYTGRLWIGWRAKSAKQNTSVSLYDHNNNWLGNLSQDGRILRDREIGFGDYVYSMFEDKDKNIWLGTKQDGLFLLRPRQTDSSYHITHYTHDVTDLYSLSHNSVYSIIQDSEGRIWLGTYGGGINLVEKDSVENKIRFIHAKNQLSNYPIHTCNKVRCLYESTNAVILAGTTDGLVSFSKTFSRPETIFFYQNRVDGHPSSLSNNDVLNICQSEEGTIFITALSGGINMTKEDLLSEHIKFDHYNKKNGLLSDFSISTIEDANGLIWMASENSLSKFDPVTHAIEDYSQQILKVDFEISEACPLLRRSGQIIFGTIDGTLFINPDNIHKSNFIPPIVFSEIDIYIGGNSRKETLSNNRKELELVPTERNFMVNFTALDYSNPDGIEYAYRMTNLAEQWIYIGKNRSATFTGLPPGKYELQVKSTNGDGVWVENETSLFIHVQPKFRETGWAVVLFSLLIALILALIFYFILYIINLRNKVDFEQKLTNLKLRFFTDISHELRTPLTLIVNPIEEVINQEKLTLEGTENMQVARRNVNRMLQLINQILDFRKIQNNKMKICIEYTDVIVIIKQVFESFRLIARQKNINFEWDCTFHELKMYTDVDKLEKIIFNLLSNAFKYTPDNKTITLSVSSNEQSLFVSVEDEGKGFHISQVNKLFSRFESAGSTSGWGSTGIGLSLVKELLHLMHGSIQVESSPGKGSLFTIQVPQRYEEFITDNHVEFILKDKHSVAYSQESIDRESIEDDPDGERPSDKEITILVIEDNSELRRFICHILSKEYHVLEACNGKQGLVITEEETPDVVISDIMMPEMDGIEYLKRIKENLNTSHIPVILLSAKATIDDRISGLEYGADDYISKPFNSAYLKARIHTLIRQREVLYHLYTSKDPVSDAQESTLQVTSFDDKFIRNVIANIEENISNSDFRIDDLADAMGMSRTVFYRKLKTIVGLAPSDFVKDMRFKYAIQLLDMDKYTISEIAYMSGFNTPQYFSKVFKDIMHYSPKEYKQKKGKAS